jgi:hypothetical protein
MSKFKKGDRVIWNSCFGYDIGYFDRNGFAYDSESIALTLQTGSFAGSDILVAPFEVFPYSDELVDQLTKKYGYEKRFSETF